MAFFSSVEGGDPEKLSEFFGPEQVDQFIRQAVTFCWGCLPKEKRNPEELERQIRRLIDRALRDFREDREAFGKASGA
jgi:hypothetical protein